MLGLSDKTISTMRNIFKKYTHIEQVIVYGSRAKGNYKAGSDIDLTLMGDALTYDDLRSVSGDLDDSNIPYIVDVSIFETLNNLQLREHIKRVGVVLYQRTSDDRDVVQS
jgi:predicted nucleotidyltransferase